MELSVLVFEVEQRRFGLAASLVSEVLRAVEPMPTPHASASLVGIINVRGQVIPVLDTRRRFGLTSREILHTDHLVVVRHESLAFAIHVDRVVDLALLTFDRAADASDEAAGVEVSVVANTSQGLVQLIAPSDLLDDADRQTMNRLIRRVDVSELVV